MHYHTCEICLNSPLPMASIDTSMVPHFSAKNTDDQIVKILPFCPINNNEMSRDHKCIHPLHIFVYCAFTLFFFICSISQYSHIMLRYVYC